MKLVYSEVRATESIFGWNLYGCHFTLYLLPSRRLREACSSTSSLMIIGIPSFLHLLSLYSTTNQTPRTCSIHPKTFNRSFPSPRRNAAIFRHPLCLRYRLSSYRSSDHVPTIRKPSMPDIIIIKKKGIAAVTTWQMANIPARSSILLNN